MAKKLCQRLNRLPQILTKSLGTGKPGSRTMLAEIFMLRLEAILRASNAPASGSSDTRFVPIKPPVSPNKDVQQAGK